MMERAIVRPDGIRWPGAPRLPEVSRVVLTGLGAVLLAGTVLALGVQNRSLKERQRAIVRRFTQPHPGMLVPAFTTTTMAGDTITIGANVDDGRQVLYFFTTTCTYCRSTWGAVDSLDRAVGGRQACHPVVPCS